MTQWKNNNELSSDSNVIGVMENRVDSRAARIYKEGFSSSTSPRKLRFLIFAANFADW